MGIFKYFFSRGKSNGENLVFDEYGGLYIKSINFYGQYEKSESGEWLICWSDTDEQNCRAGHRESGNGIYILYNTLQKKINVKGSIERPNAGKVANNGNFSIEDWCFNRGLNGIFIDVERYNNAKLNSKKCYIALKAVQELLNDPELEPSKFAPMLDVILRARKNGADKDQGWFCIALKLQGTILEKMGYLQDALSIYDEVLSINPKIGVKRKANALRKKLS